MTTADGSVLGTRQIVDNGPASRRWNLVVLDTRTRCSSGDLSLALHVLVRLRGSL
jgi:hypothetical protein